MSWRGGEQQIVYLIDELNKQGVKNFCLAKKNSEILKMLENSAITFEAGYSSSWDFITAFEIYQICKKEKINIVHLHSSRAHSLAFISTLFGNKTPFVLSRRVIYPISKNFLSRIKYNHNNIKKIICVSEASKNVLSNDINDQSKITTIYSGINLDTKIASPLIDIREKLGIDKKIKLIINTSALEQEKDYLTFLKAAKELIKKRDDVNFIILGKGSLENEIKTIVSDLSLQLYVKFLGFQSDVTPYLQQSDIFCICSKKEGLGTSILDAFANEIPVLATNVGGIPEIVINNSTGILIESGDYINMANELFDLLDNSDKRNKLIKNAKEKVKEFSKEITAKKTLQVYKKIMMNENN